MERGVRLSAPPKAALALPEAAGDAAGPARRSLGWPAAGGWGGRHRARRCFTPPPCRPALPTPRSGPLPSSAPPHPPQAERHSPLTAPGAPPPHRPLTGCPWRLPRVGAPCSQGPREPRHPPPPIHTHTHSPPGCPPRWVPRRRRRCPSRHWGKMNHQREGGEGEKRGGGEAKTERGKGREGRKSKEVGEKAAIVIKK